MRLRERFKQLRCNHDYKPWANIYGDLINDFNKRTVMLCPKCFKRRYIGEYIEAPLNYNKVLEYITHEKNKEPFNEFCIEAAMENEKQYLELFGESS